MAFIVKTLIFLVQLISLSILIAFSMSLKI